ncbi:MAG: GNAT family N-acetyltransferase [Tissierellia bacterium]|nr:GNAT family N-acetyltransferase [Tissierellia bacterium]
MELIGSLITLKPYTLEMCHEFWSEYVSDPLMTDMPYKHDESKIDEYFISRINDETRIYFAICLNDKTIGEIMLKHIDAEESTTTLSIAISNDKYKNKGYGTEAEKLIIDYGFNILNLKTIYADTVKRNIRSQHILEKLGFSYIKEEDDFIYYRLDKK